MEIPKKYISKSDFYKGKEFEKIRNDIDFCQTLIERLIFFNSDCKSKVAASFQIPDHIIDYRLNQFDYYDKVLRCIYYSCFSLRYVYDTSTYMNHKGINYTIGNAYEDQRKYVTFNAIVMMSSIFEFGRKEFERTIVGKYLKNMKEKYPSLTDSLELLMNFRNTVHSNAIWEDKKNQGELIYRTRLGVQKIKKGQEFKYDHWTLYRIIKDCIELHMLLALDNEALLVRKTNVIINGQRLSAVRTEMKLEDWDRLFQNRTGLPE